MKIIPEPNLDEVIRDKTTERLITSFVPRLLQKELETYASSSQISCSRVFPAVCLVVDIVGFIPHVSRNCSRGEEGLVQLTTLTNAFVSSLVSHVYLYGGDVIELSSGSSLICVFHPTDRTRKSCLKSCKNAAQCAWELNEMSSLDLRVRTGISFGELSFGLLGGFNNNWRFLIAGQCKSQLVNALQNQVSKTLIVSREVKDLLWESKQQQNHIDGTNNRKEDIVFDKCEMDSGFVVVKSFKTGISKPSMKTYSSLHAISRDLSSSIKNDNTFFDFYAQLCSFAPRPVIQSSINLLFDSLSCVEEVAVLLIRMDEFKGKDHTHVHTYIHTYIHTQTHTHTYIDTPTYIHTSTRSSSKQSLMIPCPSPVTKMFM